MTSPDDQSAPAAPPPGQPSPQPSYAGPQPSYAGLRPAPLPPQGMGVPPGMVAEPVARPGGFKRGFGLGMGLALGLGAVGVVTSIIMGIVTVVSLGSMVATTGGFATTGTQTIWGSPGAAKQVRVFSVSGTILAEGSDGLLLTGGTYGYEIASMMDGLEADDAEAVVLLVNTPGGSIAGSKAIADAVTRYQEETGKPVFVHVSSMSASGGVYATATASKIFADYGSLIGSIGVTSGLFLHYDGVTELTGSLLESGVVTTGGITAEVLSQGRGKDFSNPWRPMTDEERTVWMGGLKREYDAFVAHVADNRGIPASTIVDDMGAMIFDPETAQEFGLVDEVMSRADFFYRVADEIGVDPEELRFEATATPSAWEALLGAQRSYGVSPPVPQAEGLVPVVSQSFCASAVPLAFEGDLTAVCGR
ncbi:MAG TPA: S49 family peptidase [Arachnia sp.]|nr:S49 family peptidase [Arachnia sp.]HMT84713.1 S49 family peptidase [Arachnia sp.]